MDEIQELLIKLESKGGIEIAKSYIHYKYFDSCLEFICIAGIITGIAYGIKYAIKEIKEM